jgi:Uma2 family endonuclease
MSQAAGQQMRDPLAFGRIALRDNVPCHVKVKPMNVVLRKSWTPERFLAWAETQEERYEFDGIRPVAMTGGNAGHNRITTNIHAALRSRLRGTPCSYYGPDLGVQTVGSKIRYPDALITCTKFRGTEKLAPSVVVVFEVVSPTSGWLDRIGKVREYQGVLCILRYVIVESSTAGVQALHRNDGESPWTVHALTKDDVLDLPEIGIEFPVAEIYEDIDFDDAEVDDAGA